MFRLLDISCQPQKVADKVALIRDFTLNCRPDQLTTFLDYVSWYLFFVSKNFYQYFHDQCGQARVQHCQRTEQNAKNFRAGKKLKELWMIV